MRARKALGGKAHLLKPSNCGRSTLRTRREPTTLSRQAKRATTPSCKPWRLRQRQILTFFLKRRTRAENSQKSPHPLRPRTHSHPCPAPCAARHRATRPSSSPRFGPRHAGPDTRSTCWFASCFIASRSSVMVSPPRSHGIVCEEGFRGPAAGPVRAAPGFGQV